MVVTAGFSCSPSDVIFLDPYFIFMYMHYIEKNEMGWACGAYGRGEGDV